MNREMIMHDDYGVGEEISREEIAAMLARESMSEEITREELTRYVVGYEGLYTVDIFGNIIRTQDKKIMSHQTNKQGYKCVSLSKDGVQKQYKVHRLIAEAFIPNPQNKPEKHTKDFISRR